MSRGAKKGGGKEKVVSRGLGKEEKSWRLVKQAKDTMKESDEKECGKPDCSSEEWGQLTAGRVRRPLLPAAGGQGVTDFLISTGHIGLFPRGSQALPGPDVDLQNLGFCSVRVPQHRPLATFSPAP